MPLQDATISESCGITGELGTGVCGVLLASDPSFYHGAVESEQKLPSHLYLKMYFR